MMELEDLIFLGACALLSGVYENTAGHALSSSTIDEAVKVAREVWEATMAYKRRERERG